MNKYPNVSNKVLYPKLSYDINGILFKVREELGTAKNEQQYCDAIQKHLELKGISYKREAVLPKSFDGEQNNRNRIDFLIDGKIILEVKAKPFITKQDYYQTKRYLEASGVELAILVNMRRYYTHPKRILNSGQKDSKDSENSDTLS